MLRRDPPQNARLWREGFDEMNAYYPVRQAKAGADVILFGSGNKNHIKQNVESILNPPLAPEFVSRLYDTFGHLTGVGLDLPDHMQK